MNYEFHSIITTIAISRVINYVLTIDTTMLILINNSLVLNFVDK